MPAASPAMPLSSAAPEPAPRAAPGPAKRPLLRRALALARTHGAIVLLLVVSAGLRSFRLSEKAGGLIGDEIWYVQDARVILGLPLTTFKNLPPHPLSGLDPNSEHPPLAKLAIAASMKLFGDREIAWRIPSVVLGTLGIWLLYLVVQALGGSRRLALFSAFLLAFENLSFLHGRIAMLDVYLCTFMLLGTLLYLRGWFEVAGIAFGVAALCKMNAIGGLAALLFFDAFLGARGAFRGFRRESLRGLWPRWSAVAPRALAVFFFVAFFLAGLGTLDNFWTEFRTPFAHLAHMVQFHLSLTHHGPSTGNESVPPAWWLDQGGFDYLSWTWNEHGTTNRMEFRAALNEYIVWAAPFALVYAGQLAWTERSRLGAFAVASFLANFTPPFLAWAIHGRTSYIFYMLPSVPAFVIAIALGAERLPRTLRWAFAGAVLYAFFFDFPFRYF